MLLPEVNFTGYPLIRRILGHYKTYHCIFWNLRPLKITTTVKSGSFVFPEGPGTRNFLAWLRSRLMRVNFLAKTKTNIN